MRIFAYIWQKNNHPSLRRLDLLQHILYAHQMIIENALSYIEKLEKGSVRNGVIHVAARFPPDHNIAHSQNRKLLRNVRLFNLQSFAELIHALLAIAKAVKNA